VRANHGASRSNGTRLTPELKQLEALSLSNTKVTVSAVQQLSKDLPRCRITYGTVQQPVTIGPDET
jgi:hypothetical protein